MCCSMGASWRASLAAVIAAIMLTLRSLAPKRSFWRDAQFDTIRINLLKVAARVTEMATRIKVALPSSYPYQDSWLLLAHTCPACTH